MAVFEGEGASMKRAPMVAVVHCLGGSALKDGIVREELPHDCSAILELHPDGIRLCSYGCLGGGSCESVCRKGAIKVSDEGVAHVDRELCVGCGLCAKACPQHLIEIVPTDNAIQPLCASADKGPATRKACSTGCIACGMCERVCPADAIHVIDGQAQIMQERCVACGMCATKCPRSVIHDAYGIFTVAF